MVLGWGFADRIVTAMVTRGVKSPAGVSGHLGGWSNGIPMPGCSADIR